MCTLSAFGFWIFSLYNICSNENGNVMDLYKNFTQVGAAMHGSGFDLKVSQSIFGFLIFTHCAIMSRLFSSKSKLCDVFNYFDNEVSDIPHKIIEIKKPFYNHHLLKIPIILCGLPIYYVGFSMNIIYDSEWNVELIKLMSFCFSSLIILFWCYAPVMAFHIYVVEISWILASWISSFKSKVNGSGTPHDILQECKKLQQGLEMFTDTISPSIFWLFMLNLIVAIVESYLIVAFFIAQDEFTLPIILIIFGYCSFLGISIFLSYNYCTFSQIIKDAINGIKKDILDLDINEDQSCIIDGKVLTLKQAKKRTVYELDQFQGFHGNGYFTLGKELLTSIVANFVTYLIILVQFKVSEISAK